MIQQLTNWKRYERHFRHPLTHEQATLACQTQNGAEYCVVLYRGGEQSMRDGPSGIIRGNVTSARMAWRSIQAKLVNEGFTFTQGDT